MHKNVKVTVNKHYYVLYAILAVPRLENTSWLPLWQCTPSQPMPSWPMSLHPTCIAQLHRHTSTYYIMDNNNSKYNHIIMLMTMKVCFLVALLKFVYPVHQQSRALFSVLSIRMSVCLCVSMQ